MKKFFYKKATLVSIAAIAAIVACVAGLAFGGFFASDDNTSGDRLFFGGMFRGMGVPGGGGPANAGGNNTGQEAEAAVPVTGPGAQNGVLGGSFGAKDGAPGSANDSGGSAGGTNPSPGSPNDGTDNPDGASGTPKGFGGNTGGGTGDDPPSPAKPSVTLAIDAETYRAGYIIMPAKTVSFTEGETVFDVLYRECRASKIHMSSRWTPVYNSYYIEAIDNLYEFAGGNLSSWMYSVNDWYPNYGCSDYKLKDGDVIAWRYTCDLGRDIGAGNAIGG